MEAVAMAVVVVVTVVAMGTIVAMVAMDAVAMQGGPITYLL
jgi:hypothetical protein